jgi:hypothetical protein
MEIDAQDKTFAIPRHKHGRTVEGPQLPAETVAKLQDKTVERTSVFIVQHTTRRFREDIRSQGFSPLALGGTKTWIWKAASDFCARLSMR